MGWGWGATTGRPRKSTRSLQILIYSTASLLKKLYIYIYYILKHPLQSPSLPDKRTVLNCSPTETCPPSPHPTHLSLSTHGKRCVKLLSYRNLPTLSPSHILSPCLHMANAVLNCSPTETTPPFPTHLYLSTPAKHCQCWTALPQNPATFFFFPSCTSNPVHSTTQAHAVCYITCFLSLSWKALMRAASILAPPSHFFSHGWARHSSSVKRSLEREKKDWFKDLEPPPSR